MAVPALRGQDRTNLLLEEFDLLARPFRLLGPDRRRYCQQCDDEGSSFEIGTLLEFEQLESAIDALAEDELQSDQAREDQVS